MDEVQLMGPGLKTTAQLHAFREALGTAGPAHSLWMSATLRPDDLRTVDSVPPGGATDDCVRGLSAEDEAHPMLATRLRAAKPLAPADVRLSPETRHTYARRLADLVREAHKPGSLTLIILNQVRRAQEAFLALQEACDPDGPERLLLHSRFRAAEREALGARLQDDVPVDGPGRIVVATQAVEAGVDLSARTLFTELSPWSSMVQRFGRCNRQGEWGTDDAAQVYWIDLAPGQAQDTQPYKADDLAAARERLSRLADVGISSVHGIPDPRPAPITQVLRRRDLLDLFDTTPDLAGNDLDVSPYVRETDDLDVQLFWRKVGDDGPSADEPAPRPGELCTVRLPPFRKCLEKGTDRGARGWVWDALDREWVRLDRYRLHPGLTVLLDAGAGGYVRELGWWDGAGKPEPVEPIPTQGSGSEGYGSDAYTEATRFVSLSDHTAGVVLQAKALAEALACEELEALLLAARWHDAGKAHPVFQARLTAGLAEDDPRRSTTWAKTPKDVYGEGDARPHFRHELASALAALQAGLPDLAVYLAAAHHGKVRASIRSLPGERPPEGRPDARVARGILEGDVLPSTDLGSGVVMPDTALSLGVMELGESDAGPSWVSRVLLLRERLGPFRLAYLEALLRVADWRASQAEEADGN
jgi:CRISPR-associated endonuclease/helicase Cas3